MTKRKSDETDKDGWKRRDKERREVEWWNV